jgi:hypothetical protein
VPWKLKSLTAGWPPQAVLEREDDVEEAVLHRLFTFLGGKRVLRYGYGTSAGIADLNALMQRVDAIRTQLFEAMAELPARASIAEWLGKLEEASQELLTYFSALSRSSCVNAKGRSNRSTGERTRQLRTGSGRAPAAVGDSDLPSAELIVDRSSVLREGSPCVPDTFGPVPGVEVGEHAHRRRKCVGPYARRCVGIIHDSREGLGGS